MMRGTATPDASVSACRCCYAAAFRRGVTSCFFYLFLLEACGLWTRASALHTKKEGAPALAPQEPRRKICYDFFIVELPNLGVSLYGIPQFWQIYVTDIFEGERCLKSP